MIEINKIKPGTIMKAKIPKLNKIIVLKVYNNAMEKKELFHYFVLGENRIIKGACVQGFANGWDVEEIFSKCEIRKVKK